MFRLSLVGIAIAWMICACGGTAFAVPPALSLKFSTPMPGYPQAARAARIEGSGLVAMTYNRQGTPENVVMVKSTGSLILDRNTVLTVEKQWRSSGGSNATISVAVEYHVPPGPSGERPGDQPAARENSMITGYQPHPPFPAIARRERITGTLELQVTYGANGGYIKTRIVRSSGSALLDGYTADFVRMYWRSYQKETVVRNTSFDYQLH